MRTDIPTPTSQLIPQWLYLDFWVLNEGQGAQKRDYNERHRARPLDPLLPDTPVWIRTKQNHYWPHALLCGSSEILHSDNAS